MPLTPKPMAEKPHALSMVWGRRAFQNCMNQLWCTPESSAMMASSGSTARTSATTRSGCMGEAWTAKLGAVNRSHSPCQPLIRSRHGAMRAAVSAASDSMAASSWRRKVRASATMPRVGA